MHQEEEDIEVEIINDMKSKFSKVLLNLDIMKQQNFKTFRDMITSDPAYTS